MNINQLFSFLEEVNVISFTFQDLCFLILTDVIQNLLNFKVFVPINCTKSSNDSEKIKSRIFADLWSKEICQWVDQAINFEVD